MHSVPTVTFHAGALFTKPNTPESVKTAVDAGAKIIELDVSFSCDGTPVMIHSENPLDGEGIPLKEAFELVKTHSEISLNLDLKSLKNLKALAELIDEYGLSGRVFFTGIVKEWVESVSGLGIPYYLNYSITSGERTDASLAKNVAELCRRLGAVGVNADFKEASRLFCDVIHENGLSVSLWTVDIKSDMIQVLSYGADNITTNRPDMLNGILKNGR